ncbi:phospho-N-acetylmuramoyl-pentapeptide-transferase [Patescibacteria group bacterium]
MSGALPIALGLIIFSFSITSVLVVPFINLLYRMKITRRKEAPKKGKVPLFDKLHDKKAGTPIGGGILLILVVTLIFIVIFPFASHMGIRIRSAYQFRYEVLVLLFTFVAFGLLGMLDDLVKIFGKPRAGPLGMWIGLSRNVKFALQGILALAVSYAIYAYLGVHIIHIPLIDTVIDLGIFYVPFSAFIIITFANAYNVTDGLDGLSTGLLMICLMAFGVIAASTLDFPLSVFIAIWLGAIIAFLYFNIWPARIWLGDAGALSFGATLAVIGLLTGSIFALLVIGGIYLIELASSAIQIFGWRVLKKPIFPIAPIHHTFLAIGWEEPKIVARAWLAGIMLAIFGLWLATI